MQSKLRNRDGQAIVMVSISLVFMFTVVGLSVDLGWSYFLKMRLRTVAVAGALSAANYAKIQGDTCSNISCGVTYDCAGVTPPTTSLQAGCLYAAQNGPSSMTVSMIENNTTPPGLTGITPKMWVKATASMTAPNLFAMLSGYKTSVISAQAIAGVITTGGSCLYVLDTSGGITASGSGSVSSSCGIYVDGNITLSGSVSVSGTGGANVNVKGTVTNSGTGTVSPLVSMSSAVSDPLASLPTPPHSTTCTNSSPVTIVNQASYTLPAGVYCAGITIINSTVSMNPGTFTSGITTSGATLNFASGTYAFTGGGGITSSGTNNFNGTGLLLYFSGGAGITGSGGNTFSMTGVTSGTYQGILMFGDRTTGTGSLTFSGSTSSSGTIYLPKGSLTFSGGTSASPATMGLVCWDLTFSGNAYINKDPTGSLTGLGSSGTYLVQ